MTEQEAFQWWKTEQDETGYKQSEIAALAWKSACEWEREECAKFCDSKAMALGERADQCDDEEDSIELKARAWQMTVLAAELRKRSNAEFRRAE